MYSVEIVSDDKFTPKIPTWSTTAAGSSWYPPQLSNPINLETHQKENQQRSARVSNFCLLAALDGTLIRASVPPHGTPVAQPENAQDNDGADGSDNKLIIEVDLFQETQGR